MSGDVHANRELRENHDRYYGGQGEDVWALLSKISGPWFGGGWANPLVSVFRQARLDYSMLIGRASRTTTRSDVGAQLSEGTGCLPRLRRRDSELVSVGGGEAPAALRGEGAVPLPNPEGKRPSHGGAAVRDGERPGQ
jgi:hypothetical protein